MTSQAGAPDPIALFEHASGRMQEIMEGIRQGQADMGTPCAEWNVIDVMNHLIGVLELTAGCMADSPSDIRPNEADSSYAGETSVAVLAQAHHAESARVLELAGRQGIPDRVAATPFGDMPVNQIMVGTLPDQIVHGWDLAKATGQDTTLDPGLVEFTHGMLSSGFADMGREAGFNGPEIAVSDDAGPQDKMIAYMGRQP